MLFIIAIFSVCNNGLIKNLLGRVLKRDYYLDYILLAEYIRHGVNSLMKQVSRKYSTYSIV